MVGFAQRETLDGITIAAKKNFARSKEIKAWYVINR